MDAVFINPFPGGQGLNDATVLQPLGLASMAAVLEQEGYSCAIIDANLLGLSDDEVLASVPQDAKFIGLYLNSYTFDAVKRLSAALRSARSNAVVASGGPFVTAEPELVLRETSVHGCVQGEGEHAISRIMKNITEKRPAFDKDVSGGCWLSPDNVVVIRNPIERIQDLDALPFPAFHLLPPFSLR